MPRKTFTELLPVTLESPQSSERPAKDTQDSCPSSPFFPFFLPQSYFQPSFPTFSKPPKAKRCPRHVDDGGIGVGILSCCRHRGEQVLRSWSWAFVVLGFGRDTKEKCRSYHAGSGSKRNVCIQKIQSKAEITGQNSPPTDQMKPFI